MVRRIRNFYRLFDNTIYRLRYSGIFWRFCLVDEKMWNKFGNYYYISPVEGEARTSLVDCRECMDLAHRLAWDPLTWWAQTSPYMLSMIVSGVKPQCALAKQLFGLQILNKPNRRSTDSTPFHLYQLIINSSAPKRINGFILTVTGLVKWRS